MHDNFKCQVFYLTVKDFHRYRINIKFCQVVKLEIGKGKKKKDKSKTYSAQEMIYFNINSGLLTILLDFIPLNRNVHVN